MTSFESKSVKGQTRELRKILKESRVTFPKRGAFHVVSTTDGKPCEPVWLRNTAPILDNDDVRCLPGPYPQTPPDAIPEPSAPDDLPALPDCYTRRERISPTDGKKRVDYALVKNPKPGQRYFIKDGRKYREMDFADLAVNA